MVPGGPRTTSPSSVVTAKPGMTLDRATNILWFHLGHQAWHLLVADRGWSWVDAEGWLAEQVSTALLDPAP